MEPPYLRIVDEIRQRITSGELRPGDRVPSTRQITAHWGVAMATATKALTALRQEGLVRAVPGIGTVVTGHGHPFRGRTHRRAEADRDRSQDSVVRTAVEIADAEGLVGVSMRRVAAALGVGTMSLYRYVSSKEELFHLMADAVLGEDQFPDPGPPGWRAKLELAARLQWQIYRRHPWLAETIASVVEPPLLPNGMRQTEWMYRALGDLDTDDLTRTRTLITLTGYVGGIALRQQLESDALQGKGAISLTPRAADSAAADAIFASGQFPVLAGLDMPDDEVLDVDSLFEFGLQALLNGLAGILEPTRA